jgi:hypothetical protein
MAPIAKINIEMKTVLQAPTPDALGLEWAHSLFLIPHTIFLLPAAGAGLGG